MADARLLLLLGLIAACLTILTVSVLVALSEFRALTRRVNAILPEAEKMMKDARESLHRTRRMVERASQTARCVDGIVRQACTTAADTLDQIASMKAKAESFLMGHIGNGTRAEPRRRHGP